VNVEEFFTWYTFLDDEDKKIVHGLIVMSTISSVESDSTTMAEMRKHVFDGFYALKAEPQKQKK
jgi:PHP family Zn ribbon phosphoesterase